MVIEHVLLMVAVFMIGMKFMVEAPRSAFRISAPVLALRVEKHLRTGEGFKPKVGIRSAWDEKE